MEALPLSLHQPAVVGQMNRLSSGGGVGTTSSHGSVVMYYILARCRFYEPALCSQAESGFIEEVVMQRGSHTIIHPKPPPNCWFLQIATVNELGTNNSIKCFTFQVETVEPSRTLNSTNFL